MNDALNRRFFIRQSALIGLGAVGGPLGLGASPLVTSAAPAVPNSPGLSNPPRELPYPPSTLIRGIEWLAPAAKYPGTGTDMHWWAWGDDDALYVVDDDGSNFGGKEHFAHLLKVTGVPPHHKVEEISLFPTLTFRSKRKMRYVNGALAVGTRLYVAAYDYNYQRFGDIDASHADPIRPVGYQAGDGWFFDAYSQHGGVAALMFSDDKGGTWQNVPDGDTPYFLGPRFAALAFVGFGPGYTGVPDFLGNYVYAISNDENWEGGNNIFLARVPKARVLERAAWEFYAGSAGHPGWTPEEDQARPILTDPGHAGHPSMTYNRGLRRFILCYGSDRALHSLAVPREVARATWHRSRELNVYEGPTPWGPWARVHYDERWEGQHVAYLPQLPSKWLSADGISGTLMFSGDYSYFFDQPKGYVSFYGFMTRSFRFLMA